LSFVHSFIHIFASFVLLLEQYENIRCRLQVFKKTRVYISMHVCRCFSLLTRLIIDVKRAKLSEPTVHVMSANTLRSLFDHVSSYTFILIHEDSLSLSSLFSFRLKVNSTRKGSDTLTQQGQQALYATYKYTIELPCPNTVC